MKVAKAILDPRFLAGSHGRRSEDRSTAATAAALVLVVAGALLRSTPKRVLVEFSFKGEIEAARRKERQPRRHQTWRKRSKVRRVVRR